MPSALRLCKAGTKVGAANGSFRVTCYFVKTGAGFRVEFCFSPGKKAFRGYKGNHAQNAPGSACPSITPDVAASVPATAVFPIMLLLRSHIGAKRPHGSGDERGSITKRRTNFADGLKLRFRMS